MASHAAFGKVAPTTAESSSAITRGLARITIGDCFWFGLFNLLAFQIYFQEEVGGLFTYVDEITALIVLFATFVSMLFKGRAKDLRVYTIGVPAGLLVLALLVGVLGNVTSGVRVAAFAVAVDVFTFCKFPLVVLCGLALSGGKGGGEFLWRLLVAEAYVLILIMSACAVINILSYGHALDMSAGFRYGIASFRFVFYHPEVVNLFTLGLITVLLIDKPQRHRIIICLALLVMCSTLRSKAMAFAAVAAIFLLTTRNGRIAPAHVVVGALVAVFIAGNQLSNYYESGDSARSLLTSDGLSVAFEHFPLGSGFATFGSAVTASVQNYSPLYYQFGYDAVWGLSPYYTFFISDTFWPVVAAQLGFIGAGVYVVAVALALKFLYDRYAKTRRGAVVVIAALYLIICTTASSALFAPQWIYIAFVLYLGLKHVNDVDAGPAHPAEERAGKRINRMFKRGGKHAA